VTGSPNNFTLGALATTRNPDGAVLNPDVPALQQRQPGYPRLPVAG